MDSRDVVDVLREQHDEMRSRCAGVERSRGDQKARRIGELFQLVSVHERSEQAVVHPATRDSSAAGNMIGLARMAEENAIERSFGGLQELGNASPGFERGFAALCRALLEHMTREELDEFPLLRLYVPAQRLHMMAGALHDVQVMDAA
ncbi:hemerythrin domain-containing protein [Actinoplanes sp. NPDC026619]|uniref:hemerythrin domain-containing protein n=1 Tax=Actinoplanes sp. NPDC026619 TaxID=3155798 RepID=UPI0033F82825